MSTAQPEATAAITLVEGLLLTLEEKGTLSREDVDDVFETAIATHRARSRSADDADGRVVAVLKRMLSERGAGG